MSTGTPITIAVNEADRSLTQNMIPAVRDVMNVRLVGLAQYITGGGGVTLSIKSRSLKGIAVIPPVTAWDIDGDDILADIALSSPELNTIFALVSAKGTRTLTMTVEVDTPRRMLATGDFIIRNNPYNADGTSEVHPTPTVAERLQVILDTLEELQRLFSAHDHDGDNTQAVGHSDLSGKGELSHSDIDTALDNSGASVNKRIETALEAHDGEASAHSELFRIIGDGIVAHERADAYAGNNVHRTISAIRKFVKCHNASPWSHKPIRDTITDVLNAIDAAIAVHDDSQNSHATLFQDVMDAIAIVRKVLGRRIDKKQDALTEEQLANIELGGTAVQPDTLTYFYVLRSAFEDLIPNEDQTIGGALTQLAEIVTRLKNVPTGSAPPLDPALYVLRSDFNGLVPSEDLTIGELTTQLAEVIRKLKGEH